MSDVKRELEFLMLSIVDLIKKSDERNMLTDKVSAHDNEIFMYGYKTCLRDLAQRVHEVFYSDTERMSELGFEIEHPDSLLI